MEELERLRELDDQVFEQYQKYAGKITKSKFSKLYPNTAMTFQLLDMGANFLKNGIFDSCETDNYFGMKVHYRSLIEHQVKFQILFTNWCMDKSDQFATDYIGYGKARDILDSLRCQISEHQLFNPDFRIADWESFLATHPAFQGKSRKQVDMEAQKFTFKHMARQLNKTLDNQKTVIAPILGKLIMEYGELSSFVHGGTAAYFEMLSLKSESERQREYERVSGLSYQQSCSIKVFGLLMLSQTDPEFAEHYHILNGLMARAESKK